MAQSLRKILALAAISVCSVCSVATAHAQSRSMSGDRTDSAAQSPPLQDESAAESLFPSKTKVGAYGAPETKFTSILASPALLLGLQGGFVVNHHFILGLAGYGLATRHDVPVEMRADGLPSNLEMGYGGLRLGYLVAPQSLVHFGFGVLMGGGGLVAVSRDRVSTMGVSGEPNVDVQRANAEAFFAFEPELEGEVNVAQFMRVALSASYRVINGIEAPGLDIASLSGPAVGLALRFGAF